MCGRYTLAADAELIEGRFDVQLMGLPRISRYNVAPTQDVLTIAGQGPRRAGMMRWGLVPSWTKDISVGNRMINARAETLAKRPAFRTALQRRRCLVVADGFYEWASVGNHRIPMRVTLKSGEPFAFAGLWERWEKGDGEPLETFTIITTEANGKLAPLHARMPVILDPADFERWLSPELAGNDAEALLRPAPDSAVDFHAVSKHVNNARNDDLGCIEPLPDDEDGGV